MLLELIKNTKTLAIDFDSNKFQIDDSVHTSTEVGIRLRWIRLLEMILRV